MFAVQHTIWDVPLVLKPFGYMAVAVLSRRGHVHRSQDLTNHSGRPLYCVRDRIFAPSEDEASERRLTLRIGAATECGIAASRIPSAKIFGRSWSLGTPESDRTLDGYEDESDRGSLASNTYPA